MYTQHLKDFTTADMPYEDFNAGILKAGELTATVIRKRKKVGFNSAVMN